MTENTPEQTPIDDPNATEAAEQDVQADENLGDDAGVDEDGNELEQA